jgi:thioredoxin-like negative regulator of GroEL
MEIINVRSDQPSSIIKMKKKFNDADNVIVAVIVADWCGACQQFKPIWESTINNYLSSQSTKQKNKKLILATIQDTTTHEFNIHDIRGFPTIRVIKDKKLLDEKLGGMSQEHVLQMINNVKKMCVTIKKTKIKRNSKTKKSKKVKKLSKSKKTNLVKDKKINKKKNSKTKKFKK